MVDQMEIKENKDFLTTQIITYLGNKRRLIGNIEKEVEAIENKLGKTKLICADLFSGSGIVARMLKKHSSNLIVNDLENYSQLINSCYLINKDEYPQNLCTELRSEIENLCSIEKISGIITQNYASKNDNNILKGEGVFYTHENAVLIDTYRNLIDKVVIEERLKKLRQEPLMFGSEEIKELLSDIGDEIESLRAKLSKYRLIKQGMMQKLLTGEIRLV
jgi:adenine-specific DNA-methyltransferase